MDTLCTENVFQKLDQEDRLTYWGLRRETYGKEAFCVKRQLLENIYIWGHWDHCNSIINKI